MSAVADLLGGPGHCGVSEGDAAGPRSVTDGCACFLRWAGADAVGRRGSEVRVVRVKNRFDPEHHASQTAGFRSVAVNVELRGRAADTEWRHVCEVQLQLASFYKLRSDQGHKRYVRFRFDMPLLSFLPPSLLLLASFPSLYSSPFSLLPSLSFLPLLSVRLHSFPLLSSCLPSSSSPALSSLSPRRQDRGQGVQQLA